VFVELPKIDTQDVAMLQRGISQSQAPVVHRNGTPTHSIEHAVIQQPARCSRRRTATDFLLALALLTVTAPLAGIAMLLIKLTSRGPVLYSQLRVGQCGAPFTLYKIRTMIHECESLTGPRWSTAGDARVTYVGRWLRRLHVDELPQLWNVLRGDMSLIGPRPERPEFVPGLEKDIPHYRERLQVRPGLTGLAQVQLPPDTDLESVRLKLAYDLYSLRHASWWLHLRICLATTLHLGGASFALITRVFGFPPREVIERAYHELHQDLEEPRRLATRNSVHGKCHANGLDFRTRPVGESGFPA
jgi:lipopolysaccharide/colanic/teichoic acid biosynthesis glycosyltransferase